MARAASSFTEREPGLQRGRGGFLRSATDTPYVTDPSEATVKSGKRKGEPKRLQYGSPSGFGKQIENQYNLSKWLERRAQLGFALSVTRGDYTLLTMAHELASLDVDSDEFKALADKMTARSKDVAETSLAAQRGTHTHELSEDDDDGRDWLTRAEAGELLGIPVDAQAELVRVWRAMLERNGLEVLAVEASCVDDVWHLAGTLDRIVRCSRELRFALHGGEIRTIDAGTVIVLDVKTGKRTLATDGTVQWWKTYGPQIASYAQSVPYDTETEQRGTWPWPVSQDHALIAHLDVLAAIDGRATCDLVYVDLVAAREHGGATVVAAKAWERRKDVFSVAQLDDENESADPTAPSAGQLPEAPPIASGENEQEAPCPSTTTLSGSEPATSTDRPSPASADGAGSTTTASPSPKSSPQSTPTSASTDVLDVPPPDEGGPADRDAVVVLGRRFLALPEHVRKGWWTQLTNEATQGYNGRGRVPYRLGADDHTVRRFELTRALVLLAEAGCFDHDFLRAVVATVVDDDCVWWPTVLPGQVVGMLDAVHAAAFAQRCEAILAGQVRVSCDDDGRVCMEFEGVPA